MSRSKNGFEEALPSLGLVFGYIAIKDLEKPGDQVDVLSRLGYGNVQIAQICGLTPAHVGTIKLRNKQSRRKR